MSDTSKKKKEDLTIADMAEVEVAANTPPRPPAKPLPAADDKAKN